MQKTGILGGTFDPVHNGHLALAEAAGEVCPLDEIILLPASVPPHKQDREITPFYHRAAMLEIAVRGRPFLHVSTVEQMLPTPSFTIDTLNYLSLHSASPVQFYFITGADTFLDIRSWKEYKKVLQKSNFIVFLRHGSNRKMLHDFLGQLGFIQEHDRLWYSHSYQSSLYTSMLTLPAVSSSEIRDMVAEGRLTEHLLPAGVSEYIRENGLYGD